MISVKQFAAIIGLAALVTPSISKAAEPEKEILFRASGNYGYYIGFAVWGGSHIVRALRDGSVRAAWDNRVDQSAYLAHGYCQDRVPDLTEGFIRFGLHEGTTRQPEHWYNPNLTIKTIRECLEKTGWEKVRQFCEGNGEGCAYWGISRGCIVNRAWVEWKTADLGRPLDWKNDSDMKLVCEF